MLQTTASDSDYERLRNLALELWISYELLIFRDTKLLFTKTSDIFQDILGSVKKVSQWWQTERKRNFLPLNVL